MVCKDVPGKEYGFYATRLEVGNHFPVQGHLSFNYQFLDGGTFAFWTEVQVAD
jgi:hypothetical protein